jgi:hypothetical protein
MGTERSQSTHISSPSALKEINVQIATPLFLFSQDLAVHANSAAPSKQINTPSDGSHTQRNLGHRYIAAPPPHQVIKESTIVSKFQF